MRRWLGEGLPRSLEEWWYSERERITEKESADVFNRKLEGFFGFDSTGEELLLRIHFNPGFGQEVIAVNGDKTLMRDQDGIVSDWTTSPSHHKLRLLPGVPEKEKAGHRAGALIPVV